MAVHEGGQNSLYTGGMPAGTVRCDTAFGPGVREIKSCCYYGGCHGAAQLPDDCAKAEQHGPLVHRLYASEAYCQRESGRPNSRIQVTGLFLVSRLLLEKKNKLP